MLELNKCYLGDCLEVMKNIDDKSIDIILCDLPYGVTKNKWDSVIPLDKIWEQYERIIKDNGVICLTAQTPFDKLLANSNMNLYKYEWIWEKSNSTGFLNANKRPMQAHENILIFYKNMPTYNPQKTYGHARKVSTVKHKRNSKKTSNYGEHKLSSYDSTERYPRTVIKFATDKQSSTLHPTQKPVALFEYLIQTYTNEGDLVLDNCSGSATAAIASIRTKRNYICIEKEKEYYDKGIERINNELNDLKMF
jgi:site-specific DNA-methyltransferase (adenine-specific)